MTQRAILAYSSFLVACLAVTATFITATTYTQLTLAVVLYPLLVFLGYRFLSLRTQTAIFVDSEIKPKTKEREISEEKEANGSQGLGISDLDKRLFLKLIGGTGITLFLLSLFNRRPTDFLPPSLSHFGSQDINTNQNDQTKKEIDGYQISQIDDGEIGYFGFTTSGEKWYIMQVDEAKGSFRYIKGTSSFPLYWENRKNLEYDYYSKIFSD